MIRRAFDIVVAARRRCVARRRRSLLRGDGRDPARVARPPDLPPAPRRQGRRGVRRAQAAHDGRRRRAHRRRPGGQRGRRAHHPRRRASCAAPRSTSCPTSSTSCAARCRSSARGPTDPGAGRRSTPSASAAGWRSSPGITGWAQVNGRASLPWAERIELDLWYVEHRSLRLDLRDPARGPSRMLRHAATASTRARPADGTGQLMSRRARPAHRRRQALRHRRAFAQHATVVAADPNPLAPAQYAAHVPHAPCRGSTTPATCPALAASCASEHDVGAVVPLTDLDIEVLAQARADGRLPALVPDPEIAARDLRQVRDATCCSSASGCPRRRPCCPGEPSRRPTR